MEKESVKKFDLEAAFKALDEIDIPVAEKGIKANRVDLKERFNQKSAHETLIEDYYDVSSHEDLEEAQDEREAEVAQAKLARIEKIVDLDAESPDDLLPSYVGKVIIQCPQCMTLFYKNPEDIEHSEENPDVVNINEVCQHCGNTSGYNIIGKVGAVDESEVDNYTEEPAGEESELDLDFEEPTEEVDAEGTGEGAKEMSEEEELSDDELKELELDLEEIPEEEPEEEKKEESLNLSKETSENETEHKSENLTLNEDLKNAQLKELGEKVLKAAFKEADLKEEDFTDIKINVVNESMSDADFGEVYGILTVDVDAKTEDEKSTAKKLLNAFVNCLKAEVAWAKNIKSSIREIKDSEGDFISLDIYADDNSYDDVTESLNNSEELKDAEEGSELKTENESENLTLNEDVDKDLDTKLKAHNDYIAYLQQMIKQEEEALKKAENDEIKAAIQRRLDAFNADLEAALPDAIKEEAPVEEVAEESVVEEEPTEVQAEEEPKEEPAEATIEEDVEVIQKSDSDELNSIIYTLGKEFENGPYKDLDVKVANGSAPGSIEVTVNSDGVNIEEIKTYCDKVLQSSKVNPKHYVATKIDVNNNVIILNNISPVKEDLAEEATEEPKEESGNEIDYVEYKHSYCHALEPKLKAINYLVNVKKVEPKILKGYILKLLKDADVKWTEKEKEFKKNIEAKEDNYDILNYVKNSIEKAKTIKVKVDENGELVEGLNEGFEGCLYEVLTESLNKSEEAPSEHETENGSENLTLNESAEAEIDSIIASWGTNESLTEENDLDKLLDSPEFQTPVSEEEIDAAREEAKEESLEECNKQKLSEDASDPEVDAIINSWEDVSEAPVEEACEGPDCKKELTEKSPKVKDAAAIIAAWPDADGKTTKPSNIPPAVEVDETPIETSPDDEAIIAAWESTENPAKGKTLKEDAAEEQPEEAPVEETPVEGEETVEEEPKEELPNVDFNTEEVKEVAEEAVEEVVKEAEAEVEPEVVEEKVEEVVADAVEEKVESEEKAPAESEEIPAEVEEPEFNEDAIDELDECSLNKHIDEYLQEVYSNVKSYETTGCELKEGKLMVEGKISFNSGKEKLTMFEFLPAYCEGKLFFEGYNKDFSEDKAFTLNCSINESKTLITESFGYKYKINENLVEGLK